MSETPGTHVGEADAVEAFPLAKCTAIEQACKLIGCELPPDGRLPREEYDTLLPFSELIVKMAADAERLAKLEAENAELRAVIGKLPVTKDGVPIVPGIDNVFHPAHGDEPGSAGARVASFGDIADHIGDVYPVADCYSTAALAALSATPENANGK